jgi:FAD/FMN-containing dehydrogenase
MLSKFDIKRDEKTLEKNSIDASIFRIVPSGVFAPRDKNELVKFVNEIIKIKKENPNEKISISSRSAGTCMSGGSLTSDLLVSFTEHLNNIIKIDKKNKTIEVEPGMYYRDMERETLKSGLILPSYPASRELCAVGGMIGNNAAGEKTFKYGKTDKYIEEIEMICADGNAYNFKEISGPVLDDVLQNDHTFYGDIHRAVYKIINENEGEIEKNRPTVTKNSSGYYIWNVYNKNRHAMNLAKLICGAQGTFGVMTKFKIQLIDAEEKSRMAVVFLEDINDMPMIVEKISPLAPESFEVFDDHTFRIAMKFLPQIIKRLGGSMFSLAKLFWPEFKMLISGNIPKIVMLIEFVEKDRATLNKKTREIEKIFNTIQMDEELGDRISAHIVRTEREAKKYWVFRRESFNLLRSKLKDVRTVPFIEDVVVRSYDLATFLPKFEEILDSEDLVYTIAGHVGDGNIHVIPLMKLRDEKSIEQIKSISDKVYTLVQQYGGSLSGEHNDGLIRSPFLHYMYTDKMLDIFKQIKKAFDPMNIFNPNKKIDVSWDYAEKLIDKRK